MGMVHAEALDRDDTGMIEMHILSISLLGCGNLIGANHFYYHISLSIITVDTKSLFKVGYLERWYIIIMYSTNYEL